MAFFQKIFRQNSRKSPNVPGDTKFDWKKPQFDDKSIRLVLFLDSDRDGRKILFDSKAVIREEEKVCRWNKDRSTNKLTSVKEDKVQDHVHTKKNHPSYLASRTGSDGKWLEEMMFGAEGVAYKGKSLKVHVIRSPPKLMLTKVFIPEKPKRLCSLDGESLPCSYSSVPDMSKPISLEGKSQGSSFAQSVPVDVPIDSRYSLTKSMELIDEDSGRDSLNSSGSYQPPSPGSSYNSLPMERRLNRNQAHSFGSLGSMKRRSSMQDSLGVEKSYAVGTHQNCLGDTILMSTNNIGFRAGIKKLRCQYPSLPRPLSEGDTTFSNNIEESRCTCSTCETPVTLKSRKCKMALGIIFGTMDEKSTDANRLFEKFFFSHIALFEGHLEKMRLDVEKAYYSGKWNSFLTGMIKAVETFKGSICDLYTARRLPDPIWLNMMSYSSYRYMLCDRFLKEFVGLASKYDGKSTNYFMSTLVTAVLTHHLAWVPTVIPAGGKPSDTYLEKHSAKWVDTLAKSHPYNPLWAQLSDLYGAIGFPLKLSRTIVVGKKADLVKKLLYVLSYFIRCSDILENSEVESLDSYIKNIEPETPCDSEKRFVPVTPTPTAEYPAGHFSSSSSPAFHSLPLDSLLSENNSLQGKYMNQNSMGGSSGSESRGEGQECCSKCLCNRTFVDSEHRVGKSVFYVDDNCSCSSTNSHTKSNLKGNCCSMPKQCQSEMQKKKNSLNLTLNVSDKDKTVNSLTSSENDQLCKMSLIDVKDSKKASIQHLSRSSDFNSIESSDKAELDIQKKSLHKDAIKSAYLKSGSNSMFDEYFHDGSEAKTIDDVNEEDRLVDLPSVSRHRNQSGFDKDDNRNKTPSLPDLISGELNEDSKLKDVPKSPRSRLGSWDPTFKHRRFSFSRQMSETSKNVPGRCRPVTPTELGKRRHISSTGSVDTDFTDPRAFCRELPMPSFDPNCCCVSQKETEKNFGRSLLADYSDHYMSDFVLLGTSDKNFTDKLETDLRMSTEYSVLDEPIAEAVCIVADTEKWIVQTHSSQQRSDQEPQLAEPSLLVTNLISTVQNMWKLKMSPEFCIMHLEDRLQEIYFKSKMLAEYIKRTKHNNTKELQEMFGFDVSDLPLLMAIAGTHTPKVPLVYLA